MALVWIIMILAVAVDAGTKYLMAGMLPGMEGHTLPLIPGVLHFTYVENPGAAFGMLAEHRWVFLVLSVVGLVAIAVYVTKEKPASRWMRACAGLILGGGIGNMIDRMGFGFAEQKGAVVDFIDFRLINFYVFNVADACVTVGCFLCVILLAASEIREAKKSKSTATDAAAESADAADVGDGAEHFGDKTTEASEENHA